ncbi:hypothetical protein ScalyP_jg9929 [Parmales sp. scaly parma]|nr:hypothetical protein ScalyP_jg9929 [Parmales sp. scaly parma]
MTGTLPYCIAFVACLLFFLSPPASGFAAVHHFYGRYQNPITTSIASPTSPTSLGVVQGSVDIFDEELRAAMRTTTHLYPDHVKVIEDLNPIVDEMVTDVLLETGDKSWQPQDYLPDLTQENWRDEIQNLRDQALMIPDDVLVVLIGDMVTEEALPTYQTLLNTFEGCDDPSGDTDTPWAKWSRGWTSEENRHGDLLNKYLYLGGRCDMRKVEVTVQHLITSGFNPKAEMDPYRGFVYTSFQERATKISHGNVGKLASKAGDSYLTKICAKIAGDEARHEKAYQRFCTEILTRDPNGLIGVFSDVLKGTISMPAENMNDGVDADLYKHFSDTAQRLGVYTAIDYAEIIEHLVKQWKLEDVTGLSAKGEADRDFVCNLGPRYKRLAERNMNKANNKEVELNKFSWIYGREA